MGGGSGDAVSSVCAGQGRNGIVTPLIYDFPDEDGWPFAVGLAEGVIRFLSTHGAGEMGVSDSRRTETSGVHLFYPCNEN